MDMAKDTLIDKPQSPYDSTEADRWLEMFSLLIHDIESPLASVKYIMKLLNEGTLDLQKPLHRRMVSATHIAVERAESIVYDILAAARSGTTGLPVTLIDLVPISVIEEAVTLATGAAAESEVGITFTNNAGNTAVQADPKLLKRMLDNLLFNAIKHTPPGEKINVYTDAGKSSLFIHIKDAGPGLGDIDASELFEKYGQLEARAHGKHRGVGLGLFFCKLAVTGMGGMVIADDHPNGGAVMTIKLNKAKE